MRFIPNSAAIRAEMLQAIGAPNLDALFASIPRAARMERELAIPPGMAEPDQLALFAELARQNEGERYSVFLGAGAYPHYSPLVIDSLIQRAEFFTSYTPYQPEISQGTLQSIFEFQTFITVLTGMEAANASVYDGASATAEAVLMADRLQPKGSGRKRALLAQSLHPHYRQVVDSITRHMDLEIASVPMEPATGRLDLAALGRALDAGTSCVVVQQPNVFGVIEDLTPIAERAHQAGALCIVIVNEALSLAALRSPGACGADIVAGEAQSFGVPVSYGGPYLGFMATRHAHVRQLPGRIAGETVDLDGRRGYVLALATREQHIRREKATSNICTNQNLVMLVALFYLTLLGAEGLRMVANQNVSLLSYLRSQLPRNFRPAFSGPGFNEVTLTCPKPAAQVVAACLRRGIVPGLDLGRWYPQHADKLLVTVTELKTKASIDALVKTLESVTK
jgi:glycine dehydrogenase subunit 1